MTQKNDNNFEGSNAAKHLARLVAVQALYQASYEQESLELILKRTLEEMDKSLNDEDNKEANIQGKPDCDLLVKITKGVMENRETLLEMLKEALDSRFSSERMEVLLRNILLAGAYEIYYHGDIASQIIISDYIDVARAFYSAKEPGLVNAVLDRLAKKLRT